ncbi:MAG: cytochrome c-type biogenesis protein CcmH [Xanthomonadales bacterium]|nr:cytochrome c-type biogenesis protein CcmH [Xanthomonadales bacterium]
MNLARRFSLLFTLIFLVIGVAHAIQPLPFKDEAQRLRFQNLTSQLRCMVCQDESLNASSADLAKDLRSKIFAMMQAGKSDDEIKHYLVARYSQFILYKPPLQPQTWLLWFGPALIVLAGAGAVAIFLKRRARADAPASIDGDDNW